LSLRHFAAKLPRVADSWFPPMTGDHKGETARLTGRACLIAVGSSRARLLIHLESSCKGKSVDAEAHPRNHLQRLASLCTGLQCQSASLPDWPTHNAVNAVTAIADVPCEWSIYQGVWGVDCVYF